MSAFDAFMNRLFASKGKQDAVIENQDGAEAREGRQEALNEQGLLTDETGRPMPLPRGKMPSLGDIRRQYERAPSFASRRAIARPMP